MTTKHKRHNKRSRKTKVKGTVKGTGRGRDNRYYTEKNNSDRDSVDEGMEEVLTTIGIPNTDKYDNQNGWLAVGVVGVIGVIMLGITVIKRR
jgi:ElaB/YqjD/DUF883 family membrane-anchored ribosome-binding protein